MFECPVCGDAVQDNDDLLICDECFSEASAIRDVRAQLAAAQQGHEADAAGEEDDNPLWNTYIRLHANAMGQ